MANSGGGRKSCGGAARLAKAKRSPLPLQSIRASRLTVADHPPGTVAAIRQRQLPGRKLSPSNNPRARPPASHGRGSRAREHKAAVFQAGYGVRGRIWPCSLKEYRPELPTIRWSRTGMPRRSPAALNRWVSATSSGLGKSSAAFCPEV